MTAIPDLVDRLEKAAKAATYNAGTERREGRPALAAMWDQVACLHEESVAEISRLRKA